MEKLLLHKVNIDEPRVIPISPKCCVKQRVEYRRLLPSLDEDIVVVGNFNKSSDFIVQISVIIFNIKSRPPVHGLRSRGADSSVADPVFAHEASKSTSFIRQPVSGKVQRPVNVTNIDRVCRSLDVEE